MKKINLNDLKNLLSEVFSDSVIPEDIIDLKLGDIPEWDSVGNLNLLLLAEEKFSIEFSMNDMSSIKSVSKLIEVIEGLNHKHGN